ASASQEQSLGVQQVDDSVTQMETVTHKNAALVEESSASLASVDQQAEQLLDVIGFFKTSGRAPMKPAARSEPQRQQKRLLQEFAPQAAEPAPEPAPRSKPAAKAAAGAKADWSEF
ncbi:MAG TPA: hypothetical protein VMT98_19430, partial [Verrucomicrobiae bacterium]|nr:hypothetical protein [Verrucomicrobiae bacterium]